MSALKPIRSTTMAPDESDTTQPAATDLLPCPFCGGPAVDRACGHGRRYVGCDACEIGLSYNVATAGYRLAPPFGVRERAAWNCRTDLPKPKAVQP
jgi:hypothetical protein